MRFPYGWDALKGSSCTPYPVSAKHSEETVGDKSNDLDI